MTSEEKAAQLVGVRAGTRWSTAIGQGPGQPAEEMRSGAADEALIGRSLLPVLSQEAEPGFLDGNWKALPDGERRSVSVSTHGEARG